MKKFYKEQFAGEYATVVSVWAALGKVAIEVYRKNDSTMGQFSPAGAREIAKKLNQAASEAERRSEKWADDWF
jgi:hypothetical protein